MPQSIDINSTTLRSGKRSNTSILNETYKAWVDITVLDPSKANFLRIVQQCIDTCERQLRDGTLREISTCSTGGVSVTMRRREINTPEEYYCAEVMVTACHNLF